VSVTTLLTIQAYKLIQQYLAAICIVFLCGPATVLPCHSDLLQLKSHDMRCADVVSADGLGRIPIRSELLRSEVLQST